MPSLLKNLGTKLHRWWSGPETPAQRHAEWVSTHQPFELRFHQKKNYRWDEQAFQGQWDELFGRFLGLTPQTYQAGQTLLDVGCGSRPVLDWFQDGPRKCFLDPLLSQYREIEQMRGFWSGKPEENLLSLPAEQLAPELAGQCDFVNCWNVLDHTYDWRQILDNIRDYAKPGAFVCLGTDFESHGIGHPGIDDKPYFENFIETHFRVRARRSNYVHREVALCLVRK